MVADPGSIRVLLASDQALLRGALAAFLGDRDGIELVAEVCRAEKIVTTAAVAAPDVAVIDLDLPGIEAASIVIGLRERAGDCRTLLLTTTGRVGQCRRALEAQAEGLVSTQLPPDRLVDAIRAAGLGERVVGADLAATVYEAAALPLTTRELEVLSVAAEGASAPEIATRLCMAVGTVRNHLSAINRKTNARNRVDAIRIAAQAGWI